MKHRMKKMISLTMVFILLLGVFAGCGDAMYGGKETTPSVNAGANPDNLGGSNNDNGEINSETKEAKWQEAEMAMKSEYVSLGFNEESLSVVHMADFGEVYVGMVRTGETYDETYETIGGLDFVYNYRHSSLYKDTKPMDVYYNGECYKLSEAYENGIIKYEELFELFEMSRHSESPKLHIDDNHNKEWYILIYVTPSYNYKIYTALDFENIGCVSFRDEGMGPQSDLVSRSIVLTFNADSVANLGDIIAKLEERPDIYYIWASRSPFTFAV